MRFCILETQESWARSIEEGFQRKNHEVKRIALLETRPAAEIFKEILEFSPDAVLIQNFYFVDYSFAEGPALLELLKSASFPVLSWFIDQPESSGSVRVHLFWQRAPELKNFHFFCVDCDHLHFFLSKNLSASYLPLAAPDALQNFKPQTKRLHQFASPLSFLGTPIFKYLDSPLRSEAPLLYVRVRSLHDDLFEKIEIFKKVIPSLTAGIPQWQNLLPFINDFCREHYFEPAKYKLARSHLMEEISKYIPAPIAWCLSSLQGRLDILYSYFQMTRIVQSLASETTLSAYGGPAWKWLLPENSQQQNESSYLSMEDVLHLFSASEVNLCYTKWQYMNSVVERPLLIAAVGGGAILTDRRDALFEVWEESDIAIYGSPEEALDRYRFLQSHSNLREKMKISAREKVLKSHLISHRTDQMAQFAASGKI